MIACSTCDLIIENENECPDCNCTCGENLSSQVEGEDYGICKECELPVCENCQAHNSIHSEIDYPLHTDCKEGWY